MKGANRRQARLFKDLIRKLEPDLKKALLQAIADIKAGIDWDALIEAITARDIDAAVAALGVDPGDFVAFHQAKAGAFTQGGVLAAQTINPAARGTVRFTFDMTNPRAEAWIRENVATRVVQVSEEVKAVARQVIEAGYGKGMHPRQIATDIAGRMENGRRRGGVIGLDSRLVNYRENMRARLLSGDNSELQKVLGMTRRDKRFDAAIHRAIETGRPIPRETVARMVARYEDRLIAYRAETIARTETGFAVMSGRMEEWQQAAEKQGLPIEAVTKTWRHGGGVKDPRPDHRAMNCTTVRGLNTPFVFPDGRELQHALDARGGVHHCANCSCSTDFRFDHSYGVT